MTRILTKYIFITLSIFIGLIHTVNAEEKRSDIHAADIEAIAEKLQKKYDRAKGFSADFKQQTTLEIMNRKRFGKGKVLFQKPGLMRWDYYAPDKQILISDGENLTIYVEKDQQMIVTSAKEYLQSDVTYSFFSGTGNILQDFSIHTPGKDKNDLENTHLIKLTPNSLHPQVDHLFIWISKENFNIKKLQIFSHTGSITELLFSNIQIFDESNKNSSPTPDLNAFVFTPPPGTEIIEQ